ncbi:MAG: HAD hydrolase-like protein [Sedimenticola sp.]
MFEKDNITDLIIFDCDGVIFDSNELKTKAFANVLMKTGFSENIISEFITHHKANGGVSRYVKFERLFREILQQKVEKNTINQLLEDFSCECISLYSRAEFTPGCIDVLKLLKSKFHLFVASGSDEEELNHVFNKRKINSYFDLILGSPSTKDKCIKTILSQHPECAKSYFVGDSATDWFAASKNKCKFIYMDKFSENKKVMQELSKLNEFMVIDDLRDLAEIL